MSHSGVETGRDSAYLRGCTLVLLAGVSMSFGGLVVRLIEGASEWQILFYRSLCLVAVLFLVLLRANPRGAIASFRKAGLVGAAAGACLACAFTGFVFSITHTSVANTLFVLSAAPFIAAVLGRMFLGERVRRATWLAMVAAALGIAVMVGDGLVSGGGFGNLTALAAAVGFAGFSVCLRWGRQLEMIPAACLAGLFSAAVAGVTALALGQGLAISLNDFLLCALYGAVILGWALAVYTSGSRHVPAAELTLLSMTEVVLGSLWPWLVLGETPSGLTLLGGVVVLGAIAGQAIAGLRRQRPPVGIV